MPRPVSTQPPPGYTPPATITPIPTPTADRNEYGFVYGLAWSPDSHWLATYDTQSIRIWNAGTGELAAITLHSDIEYLNPIQMSWSPDGSAIDTIEYIGYSRQVRFWDPVSGEEVGRLATGEPATALWSPLGDKLLIKASMQPSTGFELWGPAGTVTGK